MSRISILGVLVLCVFPTGDALSDTFGNGANSFSIEFVTVGKPNNPADITGNPRPAGSVAYTYRIGKFEISEELIRKANIEAGLSISIDSRGENMPATSVSWVEAATFVNLLNTSSGYTPAYKFEQGILKLWQPGDTGYDPQNLFRNNLARYVLPSVDEWYKAAYFDPVNKLYFKYPTGSNSPPTAVLNSTEVNTAVFLHPSEDSQPSNVMEAGGLSPYGTMAQGGNVLEWEETAFDTRNNSAEELRGLRGGSWREWDVRWLNANVRDRGAPTLENSIVGFRVAVVGVPEPTSMMLLIMGSGAMGYCVRRHTSPPQSVGN